MDEKKPNADTTDAAIRAGSRRQRSPSFPTISLRKAVEKAAILHKENKGFLVSHESALKHLGYTNINSGNALQTVAALKAFSLIETEVVADDARQMRVSDTAKQILLGHPDRAKILKTVALKPPLFKEVWDMQAHGVLPSNDAIRSHLLWKLKFNEASIPTFITSFRDTLGFAELTEGDKVVDGAKDSRDPDLESVAVGDLVQWTCNGSDMFETPRPVRKLSDDGQWAFVPGTETGIPVQQITVVGQAMTTNEDKKTPPENPFKDTAPPLGKPREPLSGFKEDAYDLAEGRAVVRWPEKLDPASVEELEDWFGLIIRKMRRTSGLEPKAKKT